MRGLDRSGGATQVTPDGEREVAERTRQLTELAQHLQTAREDERSRLARELLDGHDLVKLEVLGDQKTLYPHMPETLKAAEILVADGADVTAGDALLALE